MLLLHWRLRVVDMLHSKASQHSGLVFIKALLALIIYGPDLSYLLFWSLLQSMIHVKRGWQTKLAFGQLSGLFNGQWFVTEITGGRYVYCCWLCLENGIQSMHENIMYIAADSVLRMAYNPCMRTLCILLLPLFGEWHTIHARKHYVYRYWLFFFLRIAYNNRSLLFRMYTE